MDFTTPISCLLCFRHFIPRALARRSMGAAIKLTAMCFKRNVRLAVSRLFGSTKSETINQKACYCEKSRCIHNIIINRMTNQLFNQELYYFLLQTKRLGRPCLHFDKVETTIDVAAKEKFDTLVLAHEQTRGRGQRQNSWLSPPGCAMGSIKLECSKISFLGKRVCFLQHIMALSAAWTLEKMNEEKLGKDKIGLKWPNDIIYKDGNQKIGGILVLTNDSIDKYDITLSFGLNVFNPEPTTCVNQILTGSNETKSSELSIESVVANMVNNLEKYTLELDDDKFVQLKQDYEQRCLQVGQIVRDEKNGLVKVTGVNDEGYLIGLNSSAQQLCTVTKII